MRPKGEAPRVTPSGGYGTSTRLIVVEPVIPIHLEAEKPLIELARLGDVEDAQDQDDGPSSRGFTRRIDSVLMTLMAPGKSAGLEAAERDAPPDSGQ